MTSEELKIKVSLETSRLKQELRLLKQSFKELKIDSKNKRESDELANSLEKVEKTLKDIDRLESGNKLANDLDKAKKKAIEVKQAVGEIGTGKHISVGGGGSDMGADFAQMEETLSAIKNLSIAELFTQIGDSTIHLGGSVKHLKTAFTELKDGISLALHSINPFSKFAKQNDVGKGLGDALAHAGEGADNFKMHIGNAKKEFAAFTSSIPKGVAAAAAAIAVLVTAIAAVKNAITQAQQAAQIAFSAEKIGMTTEAYSEWGYVITQLGGEIDDLTDYVRTLSAAQNDVRSGAEDWVAAFEKLGMSQEEVANMSQSEMFARTITGLQNLESEVERVSLAYKIFGEDDGAKVTTLLHTNSAETERMINNFYLLGGVMSNELTTNSKILTGSLNNMRVAWQGLRNTLAEVFLPVIIPVVQWLVKAVAVVNMFIRAMFGKDLTPASKNMDNVTNSYSGYTNAAEKASTATDNVTKSIEKLKRQTMGFDELNKLTDNSYASSNSGNDSGVSQLPTGGTTGGGLNLPTTEDLGLNGISEWIAKNKTIIQDMTAILLTFGGATLAVLCFLHGNIAGGIAGLALMGIGIMAGSGDEGTWARLAGHIQGVWESLKTWFNANVKPVFTKEWWANLFDKVKEGASEKLEAVKTAISDKWEAIKEWFNTNIKPKFTKEYWLGIWNGIKDGAAEMWENFKDSDIMKFINSVKDKAVTLTATFKEKGAEIGTKIQNAWNTVKTKAAELTATFKEKGAQIRANAYNAWGRIKTKTATLTAKFKQTGAYTKINNAWNKFKTKSSTLTVKFKDAFTSAIKRAWNGLVTAINKAIGTINKIPGVNISKLPKLATGGITNGPTPAVIGEAGREAVLPLERNTGWMDTLADKIAARGGNNGSAPTKVVLSVDGKELGWATINNINSITRQTGGLQLQLV